MIINVLGPLELQMEGVPVPIGGPRQQTVLGMLSMEAGRTVPMERLVDAVWGEAPPSTARSQVQIAVSMLRRMLADNDRRAVLRTRPPGYLLDVSEDAIDVTRFERLHAEGRARAQRGDLGAAADALRAALALWRGPVLAGLDSRAVCDSAARLEEQRLDVLAERINVELCSGRHRQLVAELQELTRRYPLREQFHGELMLALYRSGRQAEALAAYRRARALLVEELGLEPGEELRRIEQAVLRGEDLPYVPPGPVTATRTAVLPRQLPTDLPDFTGRATVVADGAAMLTRRPGRVPGVPILALAGSAGVGKTALAVRIAHRVSGCFPDGQLYASLQSAGGRPVTAGEVLVRFLLALGAPPEAIPDSPEARIEVYRSRLAGRRVLILLDDVSDEAGLADLLPGSPGCAVIITSRPRMGLLPARHVEVGPLDPADALDMLGAIIGRDRMRSQPAAAESLVSLCGRMPLALRISGARLATRRHWPLSWLVSRLSDQNRRLDELQHRGVSVRAGLSVSYQRLPPVSRRLLRRLALVEQPDVTVPVCAALLDTGHDDAEDSVERLVEMGLLEADLAPDGLARYRMNGLTRAFASERMNCDEPAEQRQSALRRAVGVWTTTMSPR